ncbi:MAG: hypothetical protein MJE68_09100 [Proteobacteria bacterium]|nr:hypothetical protein [Pseudomonadota bacterium]
MQESDSGKHVDNTIVGNAVAIIISQLGDRDQLYSNWHKKLVERIMSGHCVDLSELPPAQVRQGHRGGTRGTS